MGTFALNAAGQPVDRQQRVNLDGSLRRLPVVRLITDDLTTHAATGITVTGSLANQTGGNSGGSGASLGLSGALSGGSLTTGTYSSGGTFNNLTLTITAGTGYCQGSSGGKVKVAFSGGGATTQATGYANTTTSGAITSVTIITGGSGYTSAPTITIPTQSGLINIVVDLTALLADQYALILFSVLAASWGGGGIDLLSFWASDDGINTLGLMGACRPQSATDAYFTGMSSGSTPVRGAILAGSRYVIVQAHASLDLDSGVRGMIALHPSVI